MKPTEKEIEAAARAIAFTQLTTTAELTEQEIKTIGDKIWQNHKVAASAALEAAYAVREADAVEVVTGEAHPLTKDMQEATETIEGLYKELNRQKQLRYKADYLYEAKLRWQKTDRFYDTMGALGMSFALGFGVGIIAAILMILGSCI